MEELIESLSFVTIHFFYMFPGNYAGQILLDHSNDIFYKMWGAFKNSKPLKNCVPRKNIELQLKNIL